MRYCYLFIVFLLVYFCLVCTLKNCKTKRIFVSKKRASRRRSRARGDRPRRPSWTFGIDCAVCEVGHSKVGQEQNRQTSRMLQVPIICHDLNGIPFEYRESRIDGPTQIWLQHKNVDRTVNWVNWNVLIL